MQQRIGDGASDYTKKTAQACTDSFMKMVSRSVQEQWNNAGEDVVVLHQFQRALKSPSFSPYCLKLET